jgi:hypothetical protein
MNARWPTHSTTSKPTASNPPDANSARGLILSMPSVVKRPVVQWGDTLSKETLTVGFDEVEWAERVAGLK